MKMIIYAANDVHCTEEHSDETLEAWRARVVREDIYSVIQGMPRSHRA